MSEPEDRLVIVGRRSTPGVNQWVVFLADAGKPNRQLDSVGSYADAVARAVDNDCGFLLSPGIEEEMIAAGVGPEDGQ